MNAKVFMSAVGGISDETIARYAEIDPAVINVKAGKSARHMKKLSVWLYAAAAALVLGLGVFAAVKAIGAPIDGPAGRPDTEPSELPLEADLYAMLYENVITLPADREPYDNGIESWKQTYDSLGIAYSAVKARIVETKYYLYWNNDETGPYISWGSQVSKAEISRIPEGMNGLALHEGDTVYVSDPVSMTIPDDNFDDLLKLMSEKTGRKLSSYEELCSVESFLFELTNEDLMNYRFMPIIRENTLPKREGESCCMLIRTIDGLAEAALFDRYDALYYCSIAVPTDESYASLQEKYGFRFDRDIERIAEELKALFD